MAQDLQHRVRPLRRSSSARAALPGLSCRWRRRPAAASVVAGHMAGGKGCRRTNSRAAPRAIAPRGRWQLPGPGTCTYLILPHVRRAGPPCIGNKEYGGSAQTRIGFCRSVCFSCHMPGSVSLMRHMIYAAESCVSIRGSTGEFRTSSRSSRRRASDEAAARERARKGSRAFPLDSYACRCR